MMSTNNLNSICSQIKDILEENNIKEVPSFFVLRICNGDQSVVDDFLWYIKMISLYENQLELKKYRDCQITIKELQDRLGYYPSFYNMEDKLIEMARTATFMYNGRDDVTWDDLPLEVRKHDYPYYFNDSGEDCYPYCTDVHDMN